jgi:hypothetical protein
MKFPNLEVLFQISSVLVSVQAVGWVYCLSLILLGQMHYNIAWRAYLRNMFIPESIHALMLLSSANALRATIGAEYPSSRIRRVLCRPSKFGICSGKHAI